MMQWFSRFDARRLAWGGATLALALALGGFVAAAVLWRDMLEDAEAEVERLVRLLAEHAARVIEPVDHSLQEVGAALQASGFGREPLGPQRLHEIVRPYATLGPYLLRVFVLDADGRLLGSSDQARIPEAVRYDDAWFGELAAKPTAGIVIGLPQRSRLNGRPIVPMARGVYDETTGELRGVVAAALDANELAAFHRNLQLTPGWRVLLLRDDGLPVSIGEPSSDQTWSSIGATAHALPGDQHETVRWRPAAADDALLGVRRVRPWPLLATVSVDASTVARSWRRRAVAIASVTLPGALGVLAVTGLASAVARRSRSLSHSLDVTNARYRALVESSPDGILVARAGRIEYANPAFLRMACGDGAADAAPVLGRRVDALLDVDGSPAAGATVAGPPPSRVVKAEHGLRTRDGALLEVETLIAPAVPGEDDSLLIVVRDISARKRAERRLRDSEERYRLMVEGTPDCAFVLLDREGLVEDASPVGGRLVLGQRHDLIGGPLAAIFTLEAVAVDEPARLLRQVAAEGHPVEREGWCRRTDGARFWAHVVLSRLVDERGEARGFHVLVRDIGARKALQDELGQQRRKLELLALAAEAAREREKVRIARELHDELGQILTVQQMDLDMLDAELDESPDAARGRLVQMRGRLVTALDTTRRIAGDLRPLVLDDLGLPAALEWLLAQARGRCGLQGRLRVHGEPAVLCVELSTALFRIAQESITNVMRHAQATRVQVALDVGEGSVELRIADNGRGLESPSAPRRGLGLLGIEERARLLGGAASISARPRGGTEVRVRLPLIPQAGSGAAEAEAT